MRRNRTFAGIPSDDTQSETGSESHHVRCCGCLCNAHLCSFTTKMMMLLVVLLCAFYVAIIDRESCLSSNALSLIVTVVGGILATLKHSKNSAR